MSIENSSPAWKRKSLKRPTPNNNSCIAWVKVQNLQNPEILKLQSFNLHIHNLKFKWSIVFRQTEYKSENLL